MPTLPLHQGSEADQAITSAQSRASRSSQDARVVALRPPRGPRVDVDDGVAVGAPALGIGSLEGGVGRDPLGSHPSPLPAGLVAELFVGGPAVVLAVEPLIVALPAEHELAQEEEVDLRDLAEEPFVLPARSEIPGLYGRVVAACREAGLEPEAVQKEVWLTQTIVGLVAGGIGVALVPASLRNLSRAGVSYKAIRSIPCVVGMGIVWRRDSRSKVVRSFLEVAKEVGHQEESSGPEQPAFDAR